MYTQASAAAAAENAPLRLKRRALIEEHYAPIGDYDLQDEYDERWLYVADDRGERHTTTHATFEDLCDYAGGDVLDSGMCPVAAYDLDTGGAVELHITTPIVSAAEDQGMSAHPDLTAAQG